MTGILQFTSRNGCIPCEPHAFSKTHHGPACRNSMPSGNWLQKPKIWSYTIPRWSHKKNYDHKPVHHNLLKTTAKIIGVTHITNKNNAPWHCVRRNLLTSSPNPFVPEHFVLKFGWHVPKRNSQDSIFSHNQNVTSLRRSNLGMKCQGTKWLGHEVTVILIGNLLQGTDIIWVTLYKYKFPSWYCVTGCWKVESIYFFVLHWPCSATCRLTCKFTDEKIQQNEISFEKIQVGEKFPYACIQSILGTPEVFTH